MRYRMRLRQLEMSVLSLIAHLPNHLIRVWALRAAGAQIHRSATVYHGFQVRSANKLSIDARANIGDHAILDARGGISIGRDVNLSTGVNIWTAQHAWNDPDFGFVTGAVIVGDHVWLSTRVTVLPGVRIGEGAVVAAGSVVTNDLDAWGLYAGVPARFVRPRTPGLDYRLPTAREKAWWW